MFDRGCQEWDTFVCIFFRSFPEIDSKTWPNHLWLKWGHKRKYFEESWGPNNIGSQSKKEKHFSKISSQFFSQKKEEK